jgi:hypothetical protein
MIQRVNWDVLRGSNVSRKEFVQGKIRKKKQHSRKSSTRCTPCAPAKAASTLVLRITLYAKAFTTIMMISSRALPYLYLTFTRHSYLDKCLLR